MTKRQFCVELSERTGVTLKQATALFEAHEDLIMEIIATEDNISFSWGKIFGYFKEPRKQNAYITNKYETLKANGGWSLAKSGMPGIEWTWQAKQYTPIDPTELYCEWDEAKFTTRARQYRQDRGLPEIPEYDGLPEKMIQSLMVKADEKRYGKKTKKQIQEETRNRIVRAQNSAARNHLIRIEWIKEKVAEGMNLEKAKNTKISVILNERRQQWQQAIENWENQAFVSDTLQKLNPYEIYKDESLASYYMSLMEEADLEDEEILQIMKNDLDEMDCENERQFEEEEIEKKAMYDDDGYRIDKDGNRLEYWQRLDIVYRRKNSQRKRARRKQIDRELADEKELEQFRAAVEKREEEREERKRLKAEKEKLKQETEANKDITGEVT